MKYSYKLRLSSRVFSLAVLTLIFGFAAVRPVSAQPRYERKSISFIDALWLTTPQARRIESRYVGVILTEIKQQIEMPRFDFNPLPEALISEFAAAANTRSSLTIDDLAGLMQEKLVPPILEIVEGALQTRGGELVSEEKRQLFLASKAKELGITLEEIEKVMNAAYIFLPALSDYSLEKSKDSDRWTCKLAGGIIWYHIDLSSGTPVVRLRVKHSTESMGFGSKEFAVESAASNFARNLQTATRAIAEFTLSAPIVEVLGRDITFPLGRKEGLGLDDPLWVGEWMAVGDGNVKFVKRGWARVGKVADNRSKPNERSSAWAVRRESWSPGMQVKEHPRLGIDIAVKTGLYQFKHREGYIPLIGDYLWVKEPFDGMTFGFDLDAQVNIANIVNKRQTFFIVGGHFLFPPAEYEGGSYFADITTNPPLVWGIQSGFMRRFYIGQWALSAEIEAAARFYSIEQTFSYGSWLAGYTDYTLIIRNHTFGFQTVLNLEYASTPDLNYGLRIGWRAFPTSDVWTYELKPGSKGDLTPIIGYPLPEISHSGMTIGVYCHFTPPQLPFDPVKLLQGAMGR